MGRLADGVRVRTTGAKQGSEAGAGGTVDVSNFITADSVDTLTNKSIDYSQLTGAPIAATYTFTAVGTEDNYWSVTGGGFTNEIEPTLVLTPGLQYKFINSAGSSHPLVLSDSSGSIFFTTTDEELWTVPNNFTTGIYQCSIHTTTMSGTIKSVTDATSWLTKDGNKWQLGTDSDKGQIRVFADTTGQYYGNMEFKCESVSSENRSFMKIVGNGQDYGGAGTPWQPIGGEAMRGGVAFGNAGIAIDRAWSGEPGIHVFHTNVEGNTNQTKFRFHGWNTSYDSYPARSGTSSADFGVSVICDGSGFSSVSDERKKTGITTIANALNTVAQLRGVSYKLVNSELTPQTHVSMDNGTKLGFVAQEVIPLLPSIVIDAGGEQAVPRENGWCDRYGIDYGSVTPLLAEAIKELKAKNEALEARIASLEQA